MRSRVVVCIWITLQILVVLATIAAVILLDDVRQLGLLAVFRRDVSPGEIIGVGVSLLFVGGTWWLLSGEPFQFRIGDYVSTSVGPGTVTRRRRLHGMPVFEVEFEAGTPMAFMADELKLLPRSAPGRPWYRPRRLPS